MRRQVIVSAPNVSKWYDADNKAVNCDCHFSRLHHFDSFGFIWFSFRCALYVHFDNIVWKWRDAIAFCKSHERHANSERSSFYGKRSRPVKIVLKLFLKCTHELSEDEMAVCSCKRKKICLRKQLNEEETSLQCIKERSCASEICFDSIRM